MKGLEIDREIRIMEVCGTHTMSVLRSGIKRLLPNNIKLISGPGCPVCVTSQGYIDAAIELSKRKDIIITTFGDMLNTPGTNGSLSIHKALGMDIRVVYSPLEALNVARINPNKEVVFLAIGFETTAPIIAIAIKKAYIEKLENFSVFNTLKTMPEAIKALISDKDVKLDGIICPGHVCTIIGERDFSFVSEELKIPSIIAGFEYQDIMAAIYLLVDMIRENQSNLKNIYSRFVKYDGNKKAKELIADVFQCSNSNWRGLGFIKNSGLQINNKYKDYDSEVKFNIKIKENKTSKECICGYIIQGKKSPENCKFFCSECTPSNPLGVCMVSKEGTCRIHYMYLN